MLSAKKMAVGLTEVDFLGMTIRNGAYVPQPHLAKELLRFPDENLTRTQIQQFLGIVNYLRDFVPRLSTWTTPLSSMLKKESKGWTSTQTTAVKHLKSYLQQLQPLHIPGEGQRILQTDASNSYWGAVLLEQNDNQRRICGYKSGAFSHAQQHYHSTMKELLAIKMGISKLKFHLIGHHFIVETDFVASRGMLKAKDAKIGRAHV